MTIAQSIILGIIEGLTEFLPISSTAHLVLAGEWLKIPSSEFLKTFEISIQLGAILAIVVLYWKRIWSGWNLIGKIAAAFLPTAVIGLIFYKLVKGYLLDNNYIIAGALLLGGLALILFERYYSRQQGGEDAVKLAPETEDRRSISYRQAAIIGVFQSLAIIPGVSRAAATIIGGLSLGIRRKDIVEFSFLLAVPTMAAATGLDLYKSRAAITALGSHDLAAWAIGFAFSFLTAIIGVRFFLKFIQKNNFVPFGWYRIGLGLIVMLWLLF